MWLLRRKIGVIGLGQDRLGRCCRVLGVSAVMGVVVWVVDFVLARAVERSHRRQRRAGGGREWSSGVAVFLLVARLVRMPELAETVDMLRAVFKRPRAGGQIRLTA